ncbi:MAG TPA: RDD family protein [Mycobacteriales bacterium]|jgi:hypothetical protein|nr:RDD family protein [Mycobacteriales bacterium]
MTPTLLRRLAARAVDGVLLAAVGVAYGLPMGFRPLWLVVHAAVVYGYFVAGDVVGTTAGKRLLGLRVTGAAGRVTAGSAARRESFVLLGAVPFAGPLLALASWVAIGVTARRDAQARGLHDTFAGGTRVVAV